MTTPNDRACNLLEAAVRDNNIVFSDGNEENYLLSLTTALEEGFKLEDEVRKAAPDWDGNPDKLSEALKNAKSPELENELKAALTDEVYKNLSGTTPSEKLESLKKELSLARRFQSKADALAGKKKGEHATPDELQKVFDERAEGLETELKKALPKWDGNPATLTDALQKATEGKLDVRLKNLLAEVGNVTGKKPEDLAAGDLKAAVTKLVNDEKEKAEKKATKLPWYQSTAVLRWGGAIAIILVAIYVIGRPLVGYYFPSSSAQPTAAKQSSTPSSAAAEPTVQRISEEEADEWAEEFVDHYIPKIERE